MQTLSASRCVISNSHEKKGDVDGYPQTYSYSRHFTSTCIRVCGYEATQRGIDIDGRITVVMHCPVGIDAERVSKDV